MCLLMEKRELARGCSLTVSPWFHIPSLPWWPTAWVCPVELREAGEAGWRLFAIRKGTGDTRGPCRGSFPFFGYSSHVFLWVNWTCFRVLPWRICSVFECIVCTAFLVVTPSIAACMDSLSESLYQLSTISRDPWETNFHQTPLLSPR